jgi:hypothetical protein
MGSVLEIYNVDPQLSLTLSGQRVVDDLACFYPISPSLPPATSSPHKQLFMMGAQQSKKFNDLTRDELAECIRALGSSFEMYAEAVLENGIDGSISSLGDDELRETLEDLGVSSRLHTRVLTRKWKTAKEAKSPVSLNEQTSNVAPPDITKKVSKKDLLRKLGETNPKLVIRTSFPPPTEGTLR